MDKTEKALERIRLAAHECVVGVSGGKDSTVLLDLVKRSGVEYKGIYSVTTIDPPPVLRFMRMHLPEVEFVPPENGLGFAQQVARRGLPLKNSRWCCDEFKENGIGYTPLFGPIPVLGITKQDERASTPHSEHAGDWKRVCHRTGEKAIQPIYDWDDDDVWAYIQQRDLPYSELYDQGYDRIGCICCPFASTGEIKENRQRWPAMFRQIRKAVHTRWDDYWKPVNSPVATRFRDADSMFEWWLRQTEPYPDRGSNSYWPLPEWAEDAIL